MCPNRWYCTCDVSYRGWIDKRLTVVLYGCETWSLTLREERSLRVFENGALRGIFGSKRDGVTGEWRKRHEEELKATCFDTRRSSSG